MKNNFKLFGTQSLRFCVIILAALFVFALTACENDTTSSADKPALTGTVAITGGTGEGGKVMVGDSLSVNTDSLGGSGKISYQWQSSNINNRDFANIKDETGAGFDTDGTLKDKWIRVVVSRADNSGNVTSAAVQVIAGELSGLVDIPWIIVVGSTITADTTQLDDGGTISYQWMQSVDQNEFTNIIGATEPTFIVTNDLAGKYLQVVVRREGKTGTVPSNAVKVRANAPVVTGVTINQGDVEVSKGGNYSFTATVTGTNLEDDDQRVAWDVTGKTSLNTSIMLLFKLWVKPMKFYPRTFCIKSPVYFVCGFVAGFIPCGDFFC